MKKSKRILWLFVALTVLFTSVCAFPTAAQTDTIETQTAEPFVLPDIVKGEQTAALYTGRVKEQEGNLNTFVFEKQGGALEMRLFDHPVKYVDEKGETKDITTALVKTADGGYQTAQNTVITKFNKNLGDGITLKHDTVDIKMVPLLESSSKVTTMPIATKEEETVTYPYGDKTSLEYSLTYMGFKEDIVVEQYTGQTAYSFMLYTNGLKVTEQDDSYFLTDDAGEIKATIGDIIIFTADERNNTFGSLTAQVIKD